MITEDTMSHYWAKFIRIGTDVFRFDTRMIVTYILLIEICLIMKEII